MGRRARARLLLPLSLLLLGLGGATPHDDVRHDARHETLRDRAGGGRRTRCTTHRNCDAGYFCESVFQTCSRCVRCRFDGDSLDGVCPTARCPGTPTRGRPPDDLAPMLRAAAVAPGAVNVADAREPRVFVKVALAVTDDVSQFKMAELVWSSVSQGVSIVTYIVDTTAGAPGSEGGAWTTREFEGSFWFQGDDEAGRWTLVRVTLRDHAANHRQYSHEDLFRLDLQRNASIDVRSHTAQACVDEAADGPWAKCIASGGRCRRAPPEGHGAGECVCEQDGWGSSKLECFPGERLDFSNESFWDGSLASGHTDASRPVLPSDIGTTWQYHAVTAQQPQQSGAGGAGSEASEAGAPGGEAHEQGALDSSQVSPWPGSVSGREVLAYVLAPCLGTSEDVCVLVDVCDATRARARTQQTDRQADRQTDTQTHRHTDRQAGRQAGRQADRQTDRQTVQTDPHGRTRRNTRTQAAVTVTASVCACVCVCVRARACVRVCARVRVRVVAFACRQCAREWCMTNLSFGVCVCSCMYVCVCVWLCICMWVWVWVWVWADWWVWAGAACMVLIQTWRRVRWHRRIEALRIEAERNELMRFSHRQISTTAPHNHLALSVQRSWVMAANREPWLGPPAAAARTGWPHAHSSDYAEMFGSMASSPGVVYRGALGQAGGDGGSWLPTLQPRAPAQVAMPPHLLPGAVNSDGDDGSAHEVDEDQECCVCFSARQAATLQPCGHSQLCRGCALFLKENGAMCPMCRHVITAVCLHS